MKYIVAALLASLVAAAPSKRQEFEQPAPQPYAQHLTPVDLDCDGDTDVVAWLQNAGDPWVYRNDGEGGFTADATKLFDISGGTNLFCRIVFDDVDADGDPDALVVSSRGAQLEPQQPKLYLNDGRGKLSDATSRLLPRMPLTGEDAVFVDVDADGDRDLFIVAGAVVPTADEQDRLLLNDGRGRFTDATKERIPEEEDPSLAVAAGDIDADGDVDFVVARRFSSMKILVNDGRGFFVDDSTKRIVQDSLNTHSAIALADMDLDGDLDLLVGTVTRSGGPDHDRFYANDGRGVFSDLTDRVMPTNTTSAGGYAAIGDFSDDGYPEVYIPSASNRGVLYTWFSGAIRDAVPALLPGHARDATSGAAVFSDFNRDGMVDMMIARGGAAPILIQFGSR